jgi:hypothetical protein
MAQAVLLGITLKGIARNAIGEVLVHADALGEDPPKACSRDI